MLRTRLTERLGIQHPILLAPMDKVAGGRLAAAVSAAGGLGLIGGGYGDAEWLEEAFADAGNQPVGAGFITWSLARKPELLGCCLEHSPSAMMLAFHEAGADIVLFGTGNSDHLRSNVASILKPSLPAADTARLNELFGALEGIGLDVPIRP